MSDDLRSSLSGFYHGFLNVLVFKVFNGKNRDIGIASAGSVGGFSFYGWLVVVFFWSKDLAAMLT